MAEQTIKNSKSDSSMLNFSGGKIMAQGAEAVLIKKGGVLVKRRVKKGYRILELDEKIRKLRTRSESKLLEKAEKVVPTPRVLKVDEKTTEIDMEFISGLKLSENLDDLKNWQEVCEFIGKNIAKLHDIGIVHGDLTTSNMIWQEKKNELLPSKKLEKQLAELKKLNLPKNEFAIFGSGPLAIRGIKDADDLDIIVKPKLWKMLAKKYPVKDATYEREVWIEIGNIDILKNWKPWFEDSDKLIEEADIIDGVRFVKLEHVISWKKSFNRDKDQVDIKSTENYLKNSGSGKLYFIDFGLGFANARVEDKAVDLYLIKEALEAKHFLNFDKFFERVLESYKKSSKNADEVLKRLSMVEKRGRYKQNY